MITHMWTNFFKTKNSQTMDAIKNCYLFENLSFRETRELSKLVHIRSYKTGETIFNQGEIGVGMYILLQGQVNIFVDHSQESSSPITTLTKGDFMGEISLVETKSRRTASAVARGDVTLIGFFKPDLDSIIERNPSMGTKILNQLAKVLGRRLRETAKKVTELRIEMTSNV